MEESVKPNCYTCVFKGVVPGNAHISCSNWKATVTGDPYGIKNGWFIWPFLFDPTWLRSCNGHKEKYHG